MDGNYIVGENISFGSQINGYDPVAAVLQLIVDDGVPDRGHRSVIFNSVLTQVGISNGYHAYYGNMITFDYATYKLN